MIVIILIAFSTVVESGEKLTATTLKPNREQSPVQCSQSCRRAPFMIKLRPLLIQHGIDKAYFKQIEDEHANSSGEIDIGRCLGSCRRAKNFRVSFQAF